MKNEAIIENLYKYVLLQVQGKKGEGYAFVALPGDYHRDVVRNYARRLLKGEYVQSVLGGGRVNMGEDEKWIKTWDYSGEFGEAPLDLVELVLKEKYPDYKLKIE